MNEAFKVALSLSCSGALLIIILFLFRTLLRGRLSKQWQYYIWLVVTARLLLPFAPETNLMNMFFQKIESGIESVKSVLLLSQEIPSAFALEEGHKANGQSFTDYEKSDLFNEQPESVILNNLWLVWLMTALILFIRKITIYQSFVKYIRAGCTEVADIALLEQFGKLVEQTGVNASVELFTNNLISSPLLIGFFRPCIILPTTELSASDFQYTILHEVTHYKRWDMFYKWLIQIAVCVHWFNPFVYLMSREVERSCELSCDEAVIKNLNVSERRAYGNTLLNATGAGGCYKDTIASVTLGESKEQLRERLDAITGFHKQSRVAASCSFALTFGICCLAAVTGAYAVVPPPDSQQTAYKHMANGDLKLIVKEYTMKELKKLNITSISISTLSDEITVMQGGDTLKLEYYAEDLEEYMEDITQSDGDKGRTLGLHRSKPSNMGEGRSVIITIPGSFQPELLHIVTTSGNITMEDCSASEIQVATQNGQIDIRGGTVSEGFSIRTENGNALISGTTLPVSGKDGSYRSIFDTESGYFVFHPMDSADHYCFIIAYGDEANVILNGDYYEAIDIETAYNTVEGRMTEPDAEDDADINNDEPSQIIVTRKSEFTIHQNADTKIYFKSLKGTLVIQDK